MQSDLFDDGSYLYSPTFGDGKIIERLEGGVVHVVFADGNEVVALESVIKSF